MPSNHNTQIDKPIAIAQVVQHLRPGGIETMALDLADFHKHNENVFIVSLEGCLQEALAHWPRLQPYKDKLIFMNKKPGLRPSLIMTLRQLFKQLQIRAVHTHHIGPLIYGSMAARLAGIKSLIHTEHDAWHLSNKRHAALQRWIIRLTRPLLTADSVTVADNMVEYLKTNNIHIVKNGIDTQRFMPGDKTRARAQLGLPQGKKIIGCSGRLEIVKGHKVLLEAFAQLCTSTHLALAGSGSLEQPLQTLAETLGIADRVHFLGRIDDMPAFYQALDVFCLPSFNEGLPLSPLEAQACAIPTVVTHVGGAHETLCPRSGRLIPKNDVYAMTKTLEKLLLESGKHNPRGFIQQHWDVRSMAHAYASLRHDGV